MNDLVGTFGTLGACLHEDFIYDQMLSSNTLAKTSNNWLLLMCNRLELRVVFAPNK